MPVKEADKLQDLLSSTTISWIGLVIALILLALAVRQIRAWYCDGDDPADDPVEILRQMEELKRQGDLSEEEFRSIRNQIDGGRDG